MRVLLVHNRHRIRGGEDVVVEDEAQLLRDGGHDVQSVIVDNPTAIVPTVVALARAPWNSSAGAAVVDAARRHRADVVHVHNTWFSLSTAVIEKVSAAGWPVVVTLHNFRTACVNGLLMRDGVPCTDCLGQSPLPAVRHRCYRDSVVQSAIAAVAIEIPRRRRTWQRCVARYLVLDHSAASLLAAGGIPAERITVRPNFTADPGPRPAPPSQSSRVVYAGRLSEEKGIEVLVEAWRRAAPAHLLLSVYGDGPLLGALKSKNVPGVRFEGMVDRSAIQTAMLDARALVFPSVCREAGPRAPIEAAASGMPVVASDMVGAAKALIGAGAGWAYRSSEPDALAELLGRLDDGAVDTAGGRARLLYESMYAPQAALTSLEATYRTVLVHPGDKAVNVWESPEDAG